MNEDKANCDIDILQNFIEKNSLSKFLVEDATDSIFEIFKTLKVKTKHGTPRVDCFEIGYKYFVHLETAYNEALEKFFEKYNLNKSYGLDQHKLASILTYAVLKSQVITVNLDIVDISDKRYIILTPNSIFATFVGITLLQAAYDKTNESSSVDLAANFNQSSKSNEYLSHWYQKLLIQEIEIKATHKILFPFLEYADLYYRWEEFLLP